jgi:hypothetical protein
MKVKVSYHIEAMGQVGMESQSIIICDSLEQAEKKIKSLRSHEMHVHIIKTVYQNGRPEKYIVD